MNHNLLEHEIPVTYQCWGCGSEVAVVEKTDLPIPEKTIWNLCKECQDKVKKDESSNIRCNWYAGFDAH